MPHQYKDTPEKDSNNCIINFKHSGRLGDIVYALPLIKAWVEKAQCKGNLYIRNDDFYEIKDSVFHPGNGVTVNQALFDYIYPLLKNIDFLNKIIYCKTTAIPQDAVDLDLFKKSGLNLHASGNQIWYRKAHSVPVAFEKKWLDFKTELRSPLGTKHHNVVINKSTRYYNKSINYSFLDEIPSVGFVGLELEYEHFIKKHQLKKLDYIPTRSALEVAMHISNADLFLGNQSLGFAIAEGLKVTRAVEVYEPIPVVIPIGGTCIEYTRTDQLLHFLSKYCDYTVLGNYPELTGGFVDSILDEKPLKLSKRVKKWWKEARGKKFSS
jgi:hypothetical protein